MHWQTLVQLALLAFSAATLVVLFTNGPDARARNTTTQQVSVAAPAPSVSKLPARFALPATSRSPAKDQAHRGTCWIFSTMGMLESSYRKNGYAKGFLKENEYVSFSEQAYGIGFVNYCKENPQDKWCFAGPASGSPSDGRPEWLYYIGSNVTKYILPSTSCPYFPDEDDALVCPAFDQAVAKNPISLKLKSIQNAYSVDSIKRMMYEKQTAMTWSHAVFEATYTIPCSDKNTGLYGTEQCTKCLHPCTVSADGCCAEMVLPGYTNQGVFGMHRYPHRGGGHAMLLVGWNDEFRVDTGLPGQMSQHTTGGFILKNSWGTDVGHSVGYWAQDHSLTDENFICPAEKSSTTWLPVNATCMKEKPDALACAPGSVKIVRKSWVHGGTVLKCKLNATKSADRAKFLGWDGCKDGMHYALVDDAANHGEVKVTAPAESDGYLRFHLVEWDPSDLTAPVKEIVTGATTWYGMENLLTPVSVKGNSEQCGFYFMPYETFTEGNVRYPIAGHDVPSVMHIDVEWSDSSYTRGSHTDGKDYAPLAASTFNMKSTKFVGPFDWNADV